MTATATKGELSSVARHIARTAAKLFAERGYDATSVREIVEAAGVAKPTLYYYFRSKEGLAQALLSFPLARLVATLRNLVTTEVDAIQCMQRVLEAHYTFCREDPDRARFIYSLLFGPRRSEVAVELEPFKLELTGWTDAAVRRLAEVGVIGRDRLDSCCAAFRGLILVSTLDFLFDDRPLGQDLAARQMHEIVYGFGNGRALNGLERDK
jgi:AcrR family transcriptional regulator